VVDTDTEFSYTEHTVRKQESKMIRFMTGLFVVMGAVGTLDSEPTASLLNYTLLAFAGLALMAWPILDGKLVDPDLRRS